MTAKDLVDELLMLPDVKTQIYFLEEQRSLLNDEVTNLLKQHADHFLRADIRISLEIADLLRHIAELTRNQLYGALGLLVEANALSIGLGEYARAIELYDEAAEIYRLHERVAEQARSQIGKVNALPHLGRFAEALAVGQWASPILEAHEQWLPLVKLIMNLGTVHGRQSEDIESLAMFDRAQELCIQKGFAKNTEYAQIQINRAVILRNLGHFDASIEASQLASEALLQLDEAVEAARAQQGLALTYFVLGRFNEALELLDNVREVFLADGRKRDAMLVELYLSDCLLQLRRFPEVIEKCKRVRGLFAEIGTHQVEALAIINEAVAYAQLRHYDQALNSLSEARQIFLTVGNAVRVASTDLERSAVLLCQERYSEGLIVAQACIDVFQSHQLPIEAAQAFVVAARAALALQQNAQVHHFLNEALRIGESLNIPTVRYQAHSLLGTLAYAQGNVEMAQMELDRAIWEVEQLRGRLMIEFRVSFLEDKEALYQDMVEICINQGEPLRGLEYAERAKSRALLDLLAYRLDLTIQARNEDDRPIVEELSRLRAERDKLYRRWESDTEIESNERGWSLSQSIRQRAQQDVLALEARITELWHRLLVHNADYARDATLWTVRTESAQPYMETDTLLLEYFVIRGKLIVFLLTTNEVEVRYLEADLNSIRALMDKLQLNLRAVPRSQARRVDALTFNARAILRRLYQMLIEPLKDQVSVYPKLMIVPHDHLHYLPFHALYDGASYLLEQHEVSYLPSASSLRYCRETRPVSQLSLVLGHSNEGRLPHAVEEARNIAAILNGEFLDEERATLAELYRMAPQCRTLHLAAHGDFRFDNPLFSGLVLGDGWLTTMDIFNLRLKTSLVTLSACQTGRNVLGGGDELLGLMRAFLSAGTASVALTLWAVEDRSTAKIMETFYLKLAEGRGKGEALRFAQLQFILGESDVPDAQSGQYAHPYYWAPFFLVGDAGPL